MKMIPANPTQTIELPARRRAFTLVELLIVISIIGVLAAFTVVALKPITINKKIATVRGELQQIQTALENYKAKYGVYPPANQSDNSKYTSGTPAQDRAQFNQLYYELSGTSRTTVAGAPAFTTMDGAYSIPAADAMTAYGVGGFVNCSKGADDGTALAKNFLLSLSTKQVADHVTNNGVSTTILVTSVNGPDDNYQPLKVDQLNPVRYICPGTNNPSSYDLWVQLQFGGKKYLVCNWNKSAQVNTSYP